MRQLAEYLPLVLFLAALFLKDIYFATATLMISYSIGMFYLWSIDGKLSKIHLGSLVFILVLGALTLFFRNEKFIQWKPSIFYWALAIAFLASHKFSEQPLIKMGLGKQIKMTDKNWFILSLMWVIFFIFAGIANLFVAYNYSMEFWGVFKVVGLTIAMLIFTIIQGFWIYKNGEFIEEETMSEDNNSVELGEVSREQRISKLLSDALPDASIDLENESHLHAGHSGAEDGRGHFRLKIISDAFTDKPSVQRHQLIYKILGDMMQTDIHALAIDAKTPDEIF